MHQSTCTKVSATSAFQRAESKSLGCDAPGMQGRGPPAVFATARLAHGTRHRAARGGRDRTRAQDGAQENQAEGSVQSQPSAAQRRTGAAQPAHPRLHRAPVPPRLAASLPCPAPPQQHMLARDAGAVRGREARGPAVRGRESRGPGVRGGGITESSRYCSFRLCRRREPALIQQQSRMQIPIAPIGTQTCSCWLLKIAAWRARARTAPRSSRSAAGQRCGHAAGARRVPWPGPAVPAARFFAAAACAAGVACAGLPGTVWSSAAASESSLIACVTTRSTAARATLRVHMAARLLHGPTVASTQPPLMRHSA
mmetsp:Transcript_102018/g.324169  ORF Transcript_102018/g.324169 Transcript_102018/m.324169 type:complete len:312 (-) Transcript_102018:23-958(-)